MQLRRSELESVAAGLSEFDVSGESGQLGFSSNESPGSPSLPAEAWLRLAEALRKLPTLDRAPCWELAMRRFGRRKPLVQAAGEIGMDPLHASALLTAFAANL